MKGLWKLENGMFAIIDTFISIGYSLGAIIDIKGNRIAPYWCDLNGNSPVKGYGIMERKRGGEQEGWPTLSATSVNHP